MGQANFWDNQEKAQQIIQQLKPPPTPPPPTPPPPVEEVSQNAVQAPPTAPPAPPAPPADITASSDLSYNSRLQPKYPPQAVRQRHEGTVVWAWMVRRRTSRSTSPAATMNSIVQPWMPHAAGASIRPSEMDKKLKGTHAFRSTSISTSCNRIFPVYSYSSRLTSLG